MKRRRLPSRVGRWTVLRPVVKLGKTQSQNPLALCRCMCGRHGLVARSALLNMPQRKHCDGSCSHAMNPVAEELARARA